MFFSTPCRRRMKIKVMRAALLISLYSFWWLEWMSSSRKGLEQSKSCEKYLVSAIRREWKLLVAFSLRCEFSVCCIAVFKYILITVSKSLNFLTYSSTHL